MIRLLLAGGIGYVLGARAGRERYEQLLALSRNLQSNPLVADAIAAARKQAGAAFNPDTTQGRGGSANGQAD